jgi:hypothetical protein
MALEEVGPKGFVEAVAGVLGLAEEALGRC